MTKITPGTGAGTAYNPMVKIENNTAPTDPAVIARIKVERRAAARAQAQRAVEAAQAKVKVMEAHLAGAETEDKRERQRAHLKGAQEALAAALAEQKKGLD